MNSKEDNFNNFNNFNDHHQSMATADNNQLDNNGCSINNSEANKTDVFIISLPSTFVSVVNTSMPILEIPEVPSSIAFEEVSIYDITSGLRRNLILATLSMIAFLLPFSDTIYVPALTAMKENLGTSDTLVTVSVAIYLFMSGICSLVWGSVSDRFGRKITLIIALTIFSMVSLVCIFAPNITVLIVLRVLQGGAVSATLVVGQSVVADLYPKDRRGAAAGFFFLPFNIGPIIGPLIGGPLSNAFGWRSTFVFLAIHSFVVLIVLFIFIPETHQYFVKERFHKMNPTKRIIDAIPNENPSFRKPWSVLVCLIDLTIVPYIAVATATYATLVTSFILFSIYLHEPPYNYTETIIGALYVPSGVLTFIGSLLGGWLSDKASKYYGPERCPEGRLVPALALSILNPAGLLIYGWAFHYKVHLTGPIIGQMVLSLGQAVFEPSVSAYLTVRKQEESAAVSAANTFINFFAAGIIVTIAIPLENAMGRGPYFSLMCGISVVPITMAGILVYRSIRKAGHCVEQQNGTISQRKNHHKTTILPKTEHVISIDTYHNVQWF